MSKFRLFYSRCWLTPAIQEKVRKERSESPDSTPEIRYKRKKVVEDREFSKSLDVYSWAGSQTERMEGFNEVKVKYIDLWGFIANPSESQTAKMEASFMAEEQELPLT